MQWATAQSRRPRGAMAMAEVLEQLRGRIDQPDLVLCFVSPSHASLNEAFLRTLETHHPQAVVMGCTAAGVIAGSEVEEGPALALVAARLPDVGLRPFRLGPGDPMPEWRELLQLEPEHEPSFVLLSDPFSGGADKLLRSLDAAYPEAVKVGGLVSGGRAEGEHALLLGGQVARGGHLGLALYGDLELRPVVAQGCRPVGPALRVSRCEGEVLHELDGRPAGEVLGEVFTAMEPRERQLFAASALVGLGIGEEEREDYLVRHIVGADPERSVLALAAPVREGQMLRFHLRDRHASAADLRAQLQRQARPGSQAALVFSCLGRGQRFYGEADHDTRMLREVLGLPDLPVGGFFANGEIGPVGGRTWLHGYTTVAGLISPRRWS